MAFLLFKIDEQNRNIRWGYAGDSGRLPNILGFALVKLRLGLQADAGDLGIIQIRRQLVFSRLRKCSTCRSCFSIYPAYFTSVSMRRRISSSRSGSSGYRRQVVIAYGRPLEQIGQPGQGRQSQALPLQETADGRPPGIPKCRSAGRFPFPPPLFEHITVIAFIRNQPQPAPDPGQPRIRIILAQQQPVFRPMSSCDRVPVPLVTRSSTNTPA